MGDGADVKEFDWKSIEVDESNILHMHWPDSMLRSSHWLKIKLRMWKFFKLTSRLKKRRGKIVWTVHNLQPHQNYHLNLVSKGLKKIAHITDGFIFLSEVSRNIFFKTYPELVNVNSVVIPHLHYKEHYEKIKKHNVLPGLIKSPNLVRLLCFGLIRLHKGYERLFEISKDLKNYNDVEWIVAGNPGKNGMPSALLESLVENNIAHGVYRHVDDVEVLSFFSSSDAVLLSYEKILNSGTAILALSLNCRVIAPAIGSLIELKSMVGADWVYLYEQPITAEKLDAAIDWVKQPLEQDAEPDLSFMSPTLVAKKTLEFYNQVLMNNSSGL